MQLPKKYVLGLGTLQPRKNFETVLKAFTLLATESPDLHLVIAGGKGWKMQSIFAQIPSALKKRIHFPGYVSLPELPQLYRRATMFVFPSLYEGFGIPPLEAMACGCPVITSNLSSLPEVVDRAALLLKNPKDEYELKAAMQNLLTPEIAEKHRRLGYTRTKHFSWTKSATAILAAAFNVG